MSYIATTEAHILQTANLFATQTTEDKSQSGHSIKVKMIKLNII